MSGPSYKFKFNTDDAGSEVRKKANLRLVELLTLATVEIKSLRASLLTRSS